MTDSIDAAAAISRTPITLVTLTMDFCTLTFGTAPCDGTGAACYNTYPTCKSKANYSKTTKRYKFTSRDAPLPFKAGERPYVISVDYLPTEIKTTLTITGRVAVVMADEPDTDVGIDPYYATRATVQGTFWKKFAVRNMNYYGRMMEIYQGFLGMPEEEFALRWKGKIETMAFSSSGVKISAVDLLKSLKDVYVPPKLEIKLVVALGAGTTAVTLSSVEGLDNAGYILIGEEIIQYTALNTVTHVLTGVTRGALGTSAATHTANDKVGKVVYFPPQNAADTITQLMITEAGLSEDDFDMDAFALWTMWPQEEILFSAIITEPVSADKLYFELMDLFNMKSWVNEESKITMRRNVPNAPDREYKTLTDDYHIIAASTDLNEDSRLSRVTLYSQQQIFAKDEEPKSYDRIDVAVDAEAESVNEYNSVIERSIYTRWLRSGYIPDDEYDRYTKNLVSRILLRNRDASPVIDIETEIKDADIVTGDYIRIDTDEILETDGSPLTGQPFQIIKRDEQGNRIKLKALRLRPERVCFIAPDASPDFDAASDADKEYGFITDENGLIDERKGYYIW